MRVVFWVKGGWVTGDIRGGLNVSLEFIRVLLRGVIVCLAILAVYLIATDNRLISALAENLN